MLPDLRSEVKVKEASHFSREVRCFFCVSETATDSYLLEFSTLEVPVLVLGVHGLTNDVGRVGTGEEVVVLISIRGQRRQDRRGHVSHGRRNMFNILNLKPLSCGILRNNSPSTLV